jgi:hypothetical protein
MKIFLSFSLVSLTRGRGKVILLLCIHTQPPLFREAGEKVLFFLFWGKVRGVVGQTFDCEL